MKTLVFALFALAGAQQTPADLYGDLYAKVELQHVFADSKAFADATAKRDPAAIMADYARQTPRSKAELATFVAANFDVPQESNMSAAAAPPATSFPPIKVHIAALWPQLRGPALADTPGSSALSLPAPYVVPGGRFREIYYWDSYFTALGLIADGHRDWADDLLTDFSSLIDRYGRIPNGTRTYYLSRSQPPFFALMVAQSRDPGHWLDALRKEHDFWMAGPNVVAMLDGSRLNRYWDDRDTPRDESYAEDVTTATGTTDKARMYRDLRAGAESGWDYSSRWLGDGRTLGTIHTTDIVPVDLNSLLWFEEEEISDLCADAGDHACADSYAGQAEARAQAMMHYLWLPDEGRFADWDSAAQRPTPVLSAATLYPLFVGLASDAQAHAVARTVEAHLLAPGGLRTTEIRTGQQWDAPNGWAPLQWIAVRGLNDYGETDLARAIATRWFATVDAQYRASGKMLEKYDIEESKPGGGGEYPLQDGFGWTNGVTRALMDLYPELGQ